MLSRTCHLGRGRLDCPTVVQERREQLLELWQTALAPEVALQLSGTKQQNSGQVGGHARHGCSQVLPAQARLRSSVNLWRPACVLQLEQMQRDNWRDWCVSCYPQPATSMPISTSRLTNPMLLQSPSWQSGWAAHITPHLLHTIQHPQATEQPGEVTPAQSCACVSMQTAEADKAAVALGSVSACRPACKSVAALQTDEAASEQRCSGVSMPTMQCRGDRAGMALSCVDVGHPALKPLHAPQTDEAAMAVELWWRGSALEALRAFVLGPLAQAGRPESVRLQKTIGSLLQPTLDAISSTPAIMVRHHSGPG